MPGTATFIDVRDDLAALLRGRKRPVGVKFGSHAFTQIDISRYENAHQLIELVIGGGNRDHIDRLQYDTQHQLEYILLNTVSVREDRFEIGPRVAFPFGEILNGPITVAKIKGDSYPYVIQLQNQLSFRFDSKDLADAKRMADDLEFMKRNIAKQDETRAAQSAALVAQYRALKTKPPVSEEQRRFIVQANAFNQQKDYGQALEYYQKALDLQPLSYPAAYFNMALLSAQLGRYRQAIAYMKQYLLLEPEAKDARSAQDKIYEWEIMLGK
jgi:tetratricopeptide (TPR) repeat protein